jgi:hypothetical protein
MNNQIGDEGVRHLADALKTNEVRQYLCISIISSAISIIIDCH